MDEMKATVSAYVNHLSRFCYSYPLIVLCWNNVLIVLSSPITFWTRILHLIYASYVDDSRVGERIKAMRRFHTCRCMTSRVLSDFSLSQIMFWHRMGS